MVKYTYDAWGNHAVEVLDSACTALSELNPYRYRGYCYDTEISRAQTVFGITKFAVNGLYKLAGIGLSQMFQYLYKELGVIKHVF